MRSNRYAKLNAIKKEKWINTKQKLWLKGTHNKHGINYNEVFAPVARWDIIRSVLALAACKKWLVYQLDVNSAFLNGELMEDVYVDQPLDYEKGGKDKVYKLRKTIYGLKQAPEALYSKIEAYFHQENFEK